MTRCEETQIFFRADACRRNLPVRGGLTGKSKYARSWLECQATEADSWVPARLGRRNIEVYKAQARIADSRALSDLLAPLSNRARSELGAAALAQPLVATDQGPGHLSFFLIGDGQTLVVFAVMNLSGFQFADIAADISSSQESNEGLDFESLAEFAGVNLSYPTRRSRRAMPPPGGLVTLP